MNKNLGLFFITDDKSVFYKAYWTMEELYTALEQDNELKEMLNDKELNIKSIQITIL